MLKVLKVTFYSEVYYNCHSLLKSFMHLSKVNFSDRYNDAKTNLDVFFLLSAQKDCKYIIQICSNQISVNNIALWLMYIYLLELQLFLVATIINLNSISGFEMFWSLWMLLWQYA